MGSNNELEIVLRLKDELTKQLKNTQSALQDAQKQGESFGDSLRRIGEYASAIGLAGLVSKLTEYGRTAVNVGLQTASFYENANIGYTTLLKSSQEASKVLAQIKKDAVATPFDASALVKANQLLISTGMTAKDARKDILNLGNAILATGGGNDELMRMSVNLQQIKNIGKATALDIKQFAFAGIPIYQMLAEATGKNVEQVKDMDITYKLLSESLEKAAQKGGMFYKATENAAGSYQQIVSNLKESIGTLFADVLVKTKAFNAIKQGLLNITNTVIENKSIIISAFIAIGKTVQNVAGIIKIIVDNINTIGYAFDFARGKLDPFIQRLNFMKERLKQILNGVGISGEFGGLQNYFIIAEQKLVWYTQRVGQEMQKIKNFLAFGANSEGLKASWIDAFDGIINRIKSFTSGLAPIFDNIRNQLNLTGEIIKTQVAPAFEALLQVLGPFLTAIMPYVKQFLEGLAVILGGILVVALAVFTGIINGLANMLPYVAQAIEGMIQFFRGFIQFLTGVFTGNFGLAMEGIKQMLKGAWDFIVNAFESILKFLSGFIKGFIQFFKNLYDVLVGHSIIPELVDAIKNHFFGLFDDVVNKASSFITTVIEKFKGLASGIMNALKSIKFPHLSVGSDSISIMGHRIEYPKLNVDWYEQGGWVKNTGLAVVHQGEYVLSKDMLAGRQSPDNRIFNQNKSQNITINAVINNPLDWDLLINKLGWKLNYSY